VITISLWSLLLASAFGGVLFLIVLLWALKGALSPGGPLERQMCPVCHRPADSEVNQYKRWLDKMHENTHRILDERRVIFAQIAALLKTATAQTMRETEQIRRTEVEKGEPLP
jgi:hypothetical protein